MARKNKLFTFVLIRETEHPIRQLRLKAWQLWSFLAGLGALFLVLALLAILGLARVDNSLRLRSLTEDNRQLHRELQLVGSRADEIESVLRDVDEFQRWTRNLANLEPMTDVVLTGGVGGPAAQRLSTEAAGVDRRLDRLSGKAQVLRQSSEEVLQAIRGNQEKLSRIPSIRPIMGGRLSSRYGRRVDPFTGRPAFHRGIDLAARRGTPIMVTADGRVKKVRRSTGGFGNVVSVDHGNGFETYYAHCDRLLVRQGQKVARGEVIATVGNTGHSTGAHLHYEVIKDGKSYNPSHYILSSEFIVD